MAFFDTFDEDKLLRQVLPRLYRALDHWLQGMAADETALMNQISAEFNPPRSRKCDIGKSGEYSVSSELFELHRRGEDQVDEYGSDLALTIEAPDFTKTAFFQFKIAKDDTAHVEAKQVAAAKRIREVFERAFVFTVDRVSGRIRLTPMTEIAGDFSGQKTKGFDINDWEAFAEWLLNWFRCKRGKRTRPEEQRTIEDLLRRFSIAKPRTRLDPGWELPNKYLPARSWLKTSIKPKEG